MTPNDSDAAREAFALLTDAEFCDDCGEPAYGARCEACGNLTSIGRYEEYAAEQRAEWEQKALQRWLEDRAMYDEMNNPRNYW